MLVVKLCYNSGSLGKGLNPDMCCLDYRKSLEITLFVNVAIENTVGKGENVGS